MDKEEITRAAREAVNDLQLDCEITEINKPIGKDTWCIQFTGSYGQFCDSFHDKAGKENSARVVREKIKRFFLKQRKPVRIVRGRSSAVRGSRSSSSSGGESSLLGTLLEVGEGAIKQAARIGGEVIERAANVNRTVLETEADWIQTISPTAAELIRPGSTVGTGNEVVPPQRTVEPAPSQTRGKQPSRAFNSTQKPASSRSTGKKATGAKKTRSTKKSQPAASKKSQAKSTKKSAASKTSSKVSKKKRATSTKRKKGSSSKKSSSKKSRGAVKLLF
jgi:hypothetical protein